MPNPRDGKKPAPSTAIARTLMLLATGLFLLARLGFGAAAPAARKPGTHPGSVRYGEDQRGPVARLRNGKVYRLGRLTEAQKRRAMEKAMRARARKAHLQR